MLKLLLTPQAIKDLEEIYEYTVQMWSLSQADKYQDLLFGSMEKILGTPKIGSLYYYKKGSYRKLNSHKHLIFYRIDGESCIVIRILHQKMDLDSYLI